jgi:hypothetical protein
MNEYVKLKFYLAITLSVSKYNSFEFLTLSLTSCLIQKLCKISHLLKYDLF